MRTNGSSHFTEHCHSDRSKHVSSRMLKQCQPTRKRVMASLEHYEPQLIGKLARSAWITSGSTRHATSSAVGTDLRPLMDGMTESVLLC